MADDRERFAQILCRIWDDDDWKALSPRAQWFYMLLVSQASLNRAGVIALTARRWAKLAKGPTVAEQISSAMTELEKAEFIVVDHDTEELFVRSYMRNDGLTKRPNVLKRALREAVEVLSQRIRPALVVELRRLKHPDADLAADAIEKGVENPFPKGYAMHTPNPSANPSAKGSDSKGSAKGSRNPGGRGRGSSSPSVGNHSPSRTAQKRGTKAPDHLLITPAMREWATTKGVTVDLDEETEQFLDRHRGKGSVFKDWTAAWRTWMRNSVKFANERAAPQLAIAAGADEYEPPQAPREVVFDPDPTALQRWHAEQRAKWQAERGAQP